MIEEGIQRFVPTKVCGKKNKLPYINRDIRCLIRKRDRLYQRIKSAQKDVSQHNWVSKMRERHHQLKKEIQRSIRRAYWTYIEGIITPMDEEGQTSIKRFWTFIKHMKSEAVGISTLQENGQVLTSPKDKADSLNRQFESVFTIEDPLPTIEANQRRYPDAPDLNITTPGVIKLLKGLKPGKAAGPDNIKPLVLKELAEELGPLLTILYRKSYDSGEIPDDWREANVTPAHKKGEKSKPVNYHPISLTCIACKVMEHIVTSHIMTHADFNKILYLLQQEQTLM